MIEKRMQDATDKLWDDLDTLLLATLLLSGCAVSETRKRNRCTDKNSREEYTYCSSS